LHRKLLVALPLPVAPCSDVYIPAMLPVKIIAGAFHFDRLQFRQFEVALDSNPHVGRAALASLPRIEWIAGEGIDRG